METLYGLWTLVWMRVLVGDIV